MPIRFTPNSQTSFRIPRETPDNWSGVGHHGAVKLASIENPLALPQGACGLMKERRPCISTRTAGRDDPQPRAAAVKGPAIRRRGQRVR